MIYVFRSFDFLTVFPKNKNSDFRARILKRTVFKPSAQVYLREIFLPRVAKEIIAYLHCSVVVGNQIGEQHQQYLRVLSLEAGQTLQRFEFSSPLLFNLQILDIDEIRFSVRDKSGNLIKLDDSEDTVIVLEFRQ